MKEKLFQKRFKDMLSKNNPKDREKRNKLFSRIRAIRRLDSKREKTWKNNRELSTINMTTGIYIEEIIKQKLKTKKKISMLDIGSGRLNFIIELKEMFKKKIEAQGISAHPYKTRVRKDLLNEIKNQNLKKEYIKKNDPYRKEKLRTIEENIQKTKKELIKLTKIQEKVGLFEDYRFEKKYDLITSFAGFHYTIKHPFVIEKLCNLLKKDGTAIVQYSRTNISKSMEKQMNENGYKTRFRKTEEGNIDIMIIENKKGNPMKFKLTKRRHNRIVIPPKILNNELEL